MKRPEKCPICGNKITRVVNAQTKNYYFKCSNKECFFVLGAEYTEEEFSLQGQKLSTECLKCGEPLTVANGPHGLYSRCYSCDCDLRPTSYNGVVYQKWVNAHRNKAKEEITALINSFKEKNSEDELYDFETYVASKEIDKSEVDEEEKVDVKPISPVYDSIVSTKTNSSKKRNSAIDYVDKIAKLMIKNPLKGYSASDIGKEFKVSSVMARSYLVKLRDEGKVKIVDAKFLVPGNYTIYYQLQGSLLPEVKVYTKKDGYSSIPAFVEENSDKFKHPTLMRSKILSRLKELGIEPVVYQSPRGFCNGYEVSLMEEICGLRKPTENRKSEKSKKINKISTVKKHERIEPKIISLLRSNLNEPFSRTQMGARLNINPKNMKVTVQRLVKNGKIKVVGWEDENIGHVGTIALKYQLIESPLPKLKTTINRSIYTTPYQFYRKKLCGKRNISVHKVAEIAKGLPATPLIINNRAYAGYSISDLKNAFKEYMGEPKSNNMELDVETAVMLSKETASNSNPVKKSIFSSITSLFKKKEKILS